MDMRGKVHYGGSNAELLYFDTCRDYNGYTRKGNHRGGREPGIPVSAPDQAHNRHRGIQPMGRTAPDKAVRGRHSGDPTMFTVANGYAAKGFNLDAANQFIKRVLYDIRGKLVKCFCIDSSDHCKNYITLSNRRAERVPAGSGAPLIFNEF